MGEVVAIQHTPSSLLQQKGRNAGLLAGGNVLGYTAILKQVCKFKDKEVEWRALFFWVNVLPRYQGNKVGFLCDS